MVYDTQGRYGLTWNVTPDMLGVLCENGRFEATNPAWEKTIGWTSKEIEDRPFFDFVHSDDMEITENAFVKIKTGEPILQFVNRYRHKEGGYRWLSWNCVPEGGKYYCSARDITQNVENKSALADSEEEARLREQFIAVLGHDLRNPLASLKAGFQILSREGGLSARGETVIDASTRTISRMARLIDDLMDFARTRLGSGLSLDITDGADLAPALEATVEEIRSVHSESKIVSRIDLERDVPCDVYRICQLASNLVANAVTHGNSDGTVTLSARTSENGLAIDVTNHGETIPQRIIDHLFEPFVREEVSPSQEGLGLGLFICSQIAQAHGADLNVNSVDGVTTFSFRLPAQNS